MASGPSAPATPGPPGLDPTAAERVQRLLRIARLHFDVPIALFSPLGDDGPGSWVGEFPPELARDPSLCAEPAGAGSALVIPDTLADSRLRESPVVRGEPHIRFYCGQPVHEPDGRRLGTVCVMDAQPRTASAADLQILAGVADAVACELGQTALRSELRARVESEFALRESEARYRAVLENGLDAIFLTRPDGAIDEANPAAEGMFGLSRDDFRRLGRQGIIAADSPGLAEYLEERRRTGRTRGELIMVRGDGSRFWAEVSSNIYRDPEGGERTITIIRDISLRKQALEREASAREEVERTSRLKSQFISVVNHEFRTALTAIQGFADVICDQELPPEEVKEYAKDIGLDARRLARMVTEMLDLDRLQSGRVRLDLHRLDLNRILRDAVNRARAVSPDRSFELHLDPELPALDLDGDMLMHVAANLLNNAVKYSPAGSEIVITSVSVDGGAEFWVRDHGSGIPETSLERIFERFVRLDERLAAIEGTGLGLPIAREIATLHGGRLWAENAPDGGAILKVALPAPARG